MSLYFLYIALSFSQEVVRGTVHQFLEADNTLKLETVGKGCYVKGTVVTDKVAGNFRFHVKPDTQQDARSLGAPMSLHYSNLDLSHEVKNVYFEGESDVVSKLLGHVATPNTPLKDQVIKLDSGAL